MGWKGNLRSVVAYANKLEREEHRRASLATKQYKAMLKQEEFENGKKAVQEYNDYIELISSTHKDASETLNWLDIANDPEPVRPVLKDDHLQAAKKSLAGYKPSFFDRLFGSSKTKIKKLEALIAAAPHQDKKVYEKEWNLYNSDHKAWQENIALAKGVLASDVETAGFSIVPNIQTEELGL
ncbi:MAG: hypothetical protein ACJ751_19080 [Niastella sp.]|jgi:hypothetical protein|uniref:hypothetical protein n=1 Tax=Niastella sp. TaxID=1869183 RepID=UPI00389A8F20